MPAAAIRRGPAGKAGSLPVPSTGPKRGGADAFGPTSIAGGRKRLGRSPRQHFRRGPGSAAGPLGEARRRRPVLRGQAATAIATLLVTGQSRGAMALALSYGRHAVPLGLRTCLAAVVMLGRQKAAIGRTTRAVMSPMGRGRRRRSLSPTRGLTSAGVANSCPAAAASPTSPSARQAALSKHCSTSSLLSTAHLDGRTGPPVNSA